MLFGLGPAIVIVILIAFMIVLVCVNPPLCCSAFIPRFLVLGAPPVLLMSLGCDNGSQEVLRKSRVAVAGAVLWRTEERSRTSLIDSKLVIS